MRTKDRGYAAQSQKTATLKDKRPTRTRRIIFGLMSYVLALGSVLIAPSCNTEANYETKDVEVRMAVTNVSSGFIECEYYTNKDAYYLIAICEPWEGYNPITNSKQFMQLALDSAYAEYLVWRNDLLRNKEFNVAPFASHSLQYGYTTRFFTGLTPYTDYWVYAFVVNPETMKPTGKLFLTTVKTAIGSTMSIFFEYRVKGRWDYTYPMDGYGNIRDIYPYVTTTRDSLDIAKSGDSPALYFALWYADLLEYPEWANVLFGVKAVENDGWNSSVEFEKGHTYYTYISGFDGAFNHHVIYKFKWDGESTNYYFTEQDADPDSNDNTGL